MILNGFSTPGRSAVLRHQPRLLPYTVHNVLGFCGWQPGGLQMKKIGVLFGRAELLEAMPPFLTGESMIGARYRNFRVTPQ